VSILLGKRAQSAALARARIELDLEHTVAYAIGDVHGCLRELLSLERKIVEDAARFEGHSGLMILLGDYVDRGRDSARVIDHLLKPPPGGFQRICLAGNHEICMLRYLDGELPLEAWLALGGAETLYSYGLDPVHITRLYGGEADQYIRQNIPPAHAEFLRGLPVMALSPGIVFVHAGIRPGIALPEQTESDLTTIRKDFLDHADRLDRWVVHGHTRVEFPRPDGRRLGIDTGAFETGRLTALRVVGRQGRLLFS
jgi:serine/threonine protein phosphatase 1